MRRVLVTGATSAVGGFLLLRLEGAGVEVVAVSRRMPETLEGRVRWVRADLRDAPPPLGPFHAWIHIARLDLLPGWLEAFRDPPPRLVAFSTTSVLTKAASSDPGERALVSRLLAAEERLRALAAARGTAWTLLRPTMIYGGGRDRNVAFIARWIRRWRVFPLVGQGLARRQPVHAEDLAEACLRILDNPRTHGKAYALGGGEVLAYRTMVERIFRCEGIAPRLLPIPDRLLVAAVRVGRRLPGLQFLSPAMVDRMRRDLVFDNGPAQRDFGYRPRRFEPRPLERVPARRMQRRAPVGQARR